MLDRTPIRKTYFKNSKLEKYILENYPICCNLTFFKKNQDWLDAVACYDSTPLIQNAKNNQFLVIQLVQIADKNTLSIFAPISSVRGGRGQKSELKS